MQAARASWSTYCHVRDFAQGGRYGVGGSRVHGDTSSRDDSQLPALQIQRKRKHAQSGSHTHTLICCSVTQCMARSWCVNISGSINLTLHLSLVRYACVSLTEVDKDHLVSPGGMKCLFSAAHCSLKTNSPNVGFTVKNVSPKHETQTIGLLNYENTRFFSALLEI